MILPPMQAGLSLNNTQAGGIATGNFIGYLSLALIGGFLASHFNPRRVILFSLLVVGLSLIATSFANSFRSAFIWRTVTGMASGGCFVPTMGLVSGWFSAKRRGLATGVTIGGTGLGLVFTGIAIPIILTIFKNEGWRISWIILGIICILAFIVSYFLLCSSPKDKGLLPIGENDISIQSDDKKINQNISFFKSLPLIYKSLKVWHLALIYSSFGFSYIIYMTFFAKFLQTELNYTKIESGNLWQLVGWISIFSGLIWGWVSDIIGRKYGIAIVCFLQGTAYLLFATFKTPEAITISAIFFGLTAWSIPAIMASACADHLGSKLASAGLGFVTLFFGIGQAAGPSFAGWFADLSGSFTFSFIVATISAYAGSAAALFLKRN